MANAQLSAQEDAPQASPRITYFSLLRAPVAVNVVVDHEFSDSPQTSLLGHTGAIFEMQHDYEVRDLDAAVSRLVAALQD